MQQHQLLDPEQSIIINWKVPIVPFFFLKEPSAVMLGEEGNPRSCCPVIESLWSLLILIPPLSEDTWVCIRLWAKYENISSGRAWTEI